jgi:DNA-binding response OmpR family regulator
MTANRTDVEGPPPARRRRRRPAPSTDSEPPRILVIDDDPDVLMLLKLLLEAGGFDPATADGGQVGLDRLDEFAPSLIVLDMMMPVIDGWEVLRTVGSRPDAPPVVVLSAKVGTPDRVRALEMGAVEYVGKPFHPQELVETIREVLNRDAQGRGEHRARVLSALRSGEPA